MSRQLLLFSLVFGLSSAAVAQTDPLDPPARRSGQTPVWLPRGAFLGTYFRNGSVTPQARLQWQLTFFEKRKDALVVLLEGGGGWAAGLPETALEGYDAPMHSFYQHTVMAGVGYRYQDPEGLHWGFQVTGGPVWYGAHFRDLPAERLSAGLMEGRIHVGYRVGPVVLGVSGGYGEPFSYRRRSVARQFLGGALFGFFADWR
ncbi:hypothetical protein [Hyalangium sp.]|uniref:hypothetical protein n=1 Tax=Hyalangium sp. TaxID=2028555 RepID=UPI002D3620E3|nr:hypothetical protein [Hyalangium sp.]HYH99930.1 hypothetical protein [Hyalangium sp.]